MLLLKTNKKSLKLSHDILKKRKIQANITRKNCSRNTVHSRIQSLFQPRYLDHFCLLALFSPLIFLPDKTNQLLFMQFWESKLYFSRYSPLYFECQFPPVWFDDLFWNLIQFDLEKIIFWLLFLCLLLFFLTQTVLPDKV